MFADLLVEKKMPDLLAQGRELGAVWTLRAKKRISKLFHAMGFWENHYG